MISESILIRKHEKGWVYKTGTKSISRNFGSRYKKILYIAAFGRKIVKKISKCS